MKRFITLFCTFLISFCTITFALTRNQSVKVIVTPKALSHNPFHSAIPDSLHFKKGEQVHFEISVEESGKQVAPSSISFTFNEDKMTPTDPQELVVADMIAVTPSATMNKSGFLRCNAEVQYNGKTYKGHSMVGFDVQDLQPTVTMPDDFLQWWNAQIDSVSTIPMEPKMELLPRRCTDLVNVYQVSVQAVEPGFRVYGILSIPKAAGKYPVVMRCPGAGVHKVGGMIDEAEQGIITLDMAIHGFPLTKPSKFYTSKSNGSLKDYPTTNIDSREHYYYRRVYLSAVRFIDYLSTLPQFDGKNLYVCGGSQGGALSIAMAVLSPRSPLSKRSSQRWLTRRRIFTAVPAVGPIISISIKMMKISTTSPKWCAITTQPTSPACSVGPYSCRSGLPTSHALPLAPIPLGMRFLHPTKNSSSPHKWATGANLMCGTRVGNGCSHTNNKTYTHSTNYH